MIKLVECNLMLKFNLMTCDETVVGDTTKLGKVISSQVNGTTRVCCVRENQLSVQIPLLSNNGTAFVI